MHCPKCDHKKSRIIRTRPDPEFPSVDLVRQCKAPGCLTIFTSREALVSIIEDSQEREIIKALASRIDALSPHARHDLMKLLQVG